VRCLPQCCSYHLEVQLRYGVFSLKIACNWKCIAHRSKPVFSVKWLFPAGPHLLHLFYPRHVYQQEFLFSNLEQLIWPLTLPIELLQKNLLWFSCLSFHLSFILYRIALTKWAFLKWSFSVQHELALLAAYAIGRQLVPMDIIGC
jgi:hypothetical protein